MKKQTVKPPRTIYNIRAEYPLHMGTFFQTDMKLRKVAGPTVGSGAGCGSRDMVWSRVRKSAAETLAKKLRILRIRGMKVIIQPQDQEWNSRKNCWQYTVE